MNETATRRGGRKNRQALRSRPDFTMLPPLEGRLPLVDPMTPEQVEKIDNASMSILEEVGVAFTYPIALDDWRKAGAKVDGERVYLDREMVREKIKTIPAEITLNARNPEKTVQLGGRKSIFVPMTGAPYLRDLDDRRRLPTIEDLGNFHKLAHMLPAMHSSAHHIVEPMDIAVSHRHLHITLSSIIHSDKTFMGMTTSGKNAEDVLDMCAILFGEDYLKHNAVVVGNCNGNSPLVWDETMLAAMRAFNLRNQPILCSPFVLGGANTPASTVPAVAQLNAEALAALTYTQIVNPGCPAIYGHFLATVSMRSGAPMAGTPEINLMNFMIGQMARHYGVPWRTTTNPSGAKTFEAQAGYESASTMMAALLSGANYLWHAAGWMEAAMTCSMAKFVVDAEQSAMGYRMAEGPRWDDFEEALAAVRDVGPGGHYLGHEHTQKNFERAFFISEFFNNDSFEQWLAEGEPDTKARALARAKTMLDEYEKPPLDVATHDALMDYIKRRENEIPTEDALNHDH